MNIVIGRPRMNILIYSPSVKTKNTNCSEVNFNVLFNENLNNKLGKVQKKLL